MSLGHSYFNLNFFNEATFHYGKAIELSQDSSKLPKSLFFLGLAFHNLDEKMKRNVIWNELYTLFPDHPLSFKSKDLIRKSTDHKESLNNKNIKNK